MAGGQSDGVMPTSDGNCLHYIWLIQDLTGVSRNLLDDRLGRPCRGRAGRISR